MLEIGQKAPEFRGDGSTIKGVVEGLKHNKIYVADILSAYLNLTTANSSARFEVQPFKRWRVIGFGMLWRALSTANEDPIVEFGTIADNDSIGKISYAITGGEKMCINDHIKYDPYDLLTPEVITEASATLVITKTVGTSFGVWQKDLKRYAATEAAVAGMSSGFVYPYMIIEVDTGGKW